MAIRKHQKAHKKHNNQPPKRRWQARLVAGKGANVLRLTGVGSAQDEATRVEQRVHKRGGGWVTSVITDVDGAAAKTTTMGVVAIGRDAIAVVSARGTIAGCRLINSHAGKGPATTKDAHRSRLGIIDDNDDHCSHHHTPFNCQLSWKM